MNSTPSSQIVPVVGPVSGPPAGADAHYLCRLQVAQPRPTLVVTPTPESAERMAADLRLFANRFELPAPLHLASWDNLPHEFVSPLPEVAGGRMAVLLALMKTEQAMPILVAPVAAVLHRLPPKTVLTRYSMTLWPGLEMDPAELPNLLATMGYVRAAQVELPGQFSIRADILDIYPPLVPGQPEGPCRVEWFGDQVDSVRGFNPVDQRSTGPIKRLLVPPVTELPNDDEMIEWAQLQVADLAEQRGLDDASITLETSRLSRTPRTAGIETWAPFFYDEPMAALDDYFDGPLRMVWSDPEGVTGVADTLARKAAEAMDDERRHGTIVPEDDALYVPLDRLAVGGETVQLPPYDQELDDSPLGRWKTLPQLGLGPLDETSEAPDGGRLAARFEQLAALCDDGPVTVVCPDQTRADALAAVLADHDIAVGSRTGQVDLLIGTLSRGFCGAEGDRQVTYLNEAELFGRQAVLTPPPRARMARFLSTFSDLQAGDAVVHGNHGIGVYRGLKRLEAGGITADFLEVEYRDGDRIYVPMDHLHLVQKYAGSEGLPTLDKLGGKGWDKTRKKVRKELTELAQELVELHAAREVAVGHAFPPIGGDGLAFAAGFPYTETPDQLRAIADISADMERPRPMDRLVCGDVGYGKTEVAFRAAFQAMADGRQVALLVPTTLLAQQHYTTALKRFAPFPFRIETVSRLHGEKERKAIMEGLANGTVDLVIGTHQLLSSRTRFKRLGLLIVDEEQRFGVAHKERIKQWKTDVDVLTLTATPIPRTLQLSLIGVRDMSLLETPPPDRRAIQTRVARFDPTLIAEAVEREMARDGQVFFVHNRVKDIGGMGRMLADLVPKARIAIAHGQMAEKELESTIGRFIDGAVDILLSTSIVESGLDIPRANTIIINRADRFGLSELYQLRGRVGRSQRQAYAYMLGPEEGWSGEAKERLNAIQAFTELGSGFRIAARDLEIRGAGSLLGHKQSGHIAAVGIETYMGLIKEAMAEIRGGTTIPAIEPSIRLGLNGAIPDDYLPDGGIRLTIYKRIASIADPADVAPLAEELRDRFGPTPEPVGCLLLSARLKAVALRLRVVQLEHTGKGVVHVTFDAHNTMSESGLRMLMAEYGSAIKFTSQHAFQLQLGHADDMQRAAALCDLLEAL